MIYTVRHLTTYRYKTPVTFARCALRLTPGDRDGQKLLERRFDISPAPARSQTRVGPFGEKVTTVTIETAHRVLKIEAVSRVDVTRQAPAETVMGAPWESVREAASASTSLDLRSPAHFLFPTARTPLLAEFSDYARIDFTPGRGMIDAARSLARRMKRDFAFDSKATEVSTAAIDAFHARRGVCQDFTHIMIACLRGLGLSAAYVSGYLRTQPPPGRPRLEGADATHAWVLVWCGEDDGWIGFDPTNAVVVGDQHIELAVGRDYSDVSPIDGVILGSGEQDLDVAVDVTPETAAA